MKQLYLNSHGNLFCVETHGTKRSVLHPLILSCRNYKQDKYRAMHSYTAADCEDKYITLPTYTAVNYGIKFIRWHYYVRVLIARTNREVC